ncbi:MAG: hypothetical protein ACHQ51_05915 [Elusimicrobiota bacterium]
MKTFYPAALIICAGAICLAEPAPKAALKGPTPEDAVVQVLTRMHGTLRYRPEDPAPRGPHEWEARRVLAAGTVNGCVESAKAFFALFREEFPSFKIVYLDSFNAVGPGGHAVVQVTGAEGQDFIVDAASFENLPGPSVLDDEALAAKVDIRKDRVGRVMQFQGRGDVFLEKAGGEYQMLVYPFGEVFDGPVRSHRSFRTLRELNQALAAYADASGVDFAYLRDHGLILPFADPKEESFVYINPAGGLARYVVYGRFSRLPEPDDAEKREPAARERLARAETR